QLNLYPGAAANLSPEQLADRMRAHIKLDFVASTISNPAAVQKESIEQLSANAFTLQFDYPNAELAQKTLDALVKRFIEEDAMQRQEQSAETVRFIDEEITTLE